jgi:hypothetical protein
MRLVVGTGTIQPMPGESAVTRSCVKQRSLRFERHFKLDAAWWPIALQKAAGGRVPVRAAAQDT